jgi:ribosomal protein S18 acetylase RimI-like enzyme
MEKDGIEIKLLGPGDEPMLSRLAPGVFDKDIDPALTREYLAEAHFHLAVAVESGVVVGMASAVDYVHPDKPRELWINEVGVAATHRGCGVATRLLRALFEHAQGLGCWQAWVLTNRSNAAAMRLYVSAGGLADADDTILFEFDLTRHEADR